jgi:response regulator RpfG family c-di-GMP phosphodiesterase
MNQIAQARIMVVGGDSHFAYLIRRYILMSSHQIVLASLADDIPTLVRSEKPSAIVLEVNLSDSTGWEVLRMLKKNPAICEIPVLLCSWMDARQHGLDEGANVFLQMPIMYEDFESALEAIGIPAFLEPDAEGG